MVNMYHNGEIKLEDLEKRRFTVNGQWMKHFYVGGLRDAKVEAL